MPENWPDKEGPLERATWLGIGVLAGFSLGSPSNLGIFEFMVPTGSFFHAQNTCPILYYRRVFPKSEEEPIFKWQWRVAKFTGMWIFIPVIIIAASLTSSGAQAIGTVLIVLSLIFCVFWTARNIMRWQQQQYTPPKQEPLLEQQSNGFIFGYQQEQDHER